MKKWTWKWRKQNKEERMERMEKWRKKGQTTVLCPTFLLNFPCVLAANFLPMCLFSSFVWCLSFLFHILISLLSPCGSFSSFIFQKSLRALSDSPFLIFFILSFLPFCSVVPHSPVFLPSFSCSESSPSSFIVWFLRFVLAYLHLPAFFHHIPSSCWKFHDSAAWPVTLHFLRTNHSLHHPLYYNLTTISGNLLGRL